MTNLQSLFPVSLCSSFFEATLVTKYFSSLFQYCRCTKTPTCFGSQPVLQRAWIAIRRFSGVLRPQAVFPRQDQPPIPQKFLGCTASYSVLMSKTSQGKNSATTRLFQVEGNNSRKPLKWQCQMGPATPRRQSPLFNNQQASVMCFCEGDIGERKCKEEVEGKKRKRKKGDPGELFCFVFHDGQTDALFPRCENVAEVGRMCCRFDSGKVKDKKGKSKKKDKALETSSELVP